jgi:thiol-disulfide isomerase/thioredoxin/flagellar basal body rod protein FlgG
MSSYAGDTNAPDFPQGMQWLNTDRPISLKDLRGKVVLLDFWTYCCINCMHILPDLAKLEEKYHDELVVIGVHSAKFSAEKDESNIEQAIARYGIDHPVVDDHDLVIWQEYGVHAWPTLVLIDPEGKIVGYQSGEDIYATFDQAIGRVIREFDKQGLINRNPIKVLRAGAQVAETLLRFPGKVLADEASGRLFTADSNHNRIIVCSLDGNVEAVVGSGRAGMQDGSFAEATFRNPQGMALAGDALYVADTDNHAIRRVNLREGTVETIAGTGQQGRIPNAAGRGRNVALNSPWDLVAQGGTLYIAMAGTHQIWRMDLGSGEVSPYAGSGMEGRVDGSLGRAALAQPSGITTDGKRLYFADSESSSIRSADLNGKGDVKTIVGQDLFVFGDRDGTGAQVRLQHPLGVTYHDGVLYVADTYNNKIKEVFPSDDRAVTFLGTGEEGLRDGDKPLFNEPGGVSVADGKLYIADTNNHSIRVADLKTRMVSTLELKGLEKLQASQGNNSSGETLQLEPQMVAPGEGRLTLSLQLPQGYELNLQAPSYVTLSSDGKAVAFSDGSTEKTVNARQFPLVLPVRIGEGAARLSARLVLYYCQETKEGLCYFKEVELQVAVKASTAASTSEIRMAYSLEVRS